MIFSIIFQPALAFKIEKPFNAEEIKANIKETMKSATNILAGKEPEIFINSINSTAAEVKVYFWCKDVTKIEYVKNDIFSTIQNKLEENGVKIL